MGKDSTKKLMYISHPYNGKEENKRAVEKIILRLIKNESIRKDFDIISPIHNYGFAYNELEYDIGIKLCTDLLSQCDVMVVFGDYEISRGCTIEIEHCKKNNIPYIIVKPVNIVNIMKYITTDELLQLIKGVIEHAREGTGEPDNTARTDSTTEPTR